MVSEESVDRYERSLEQQTDELKEALRACIIGFCSPDKVRRKELADEARDSAVRLSLLLAEPDKPEWLEPLIDQLTTIAKSHNTNVSAASIYQVAIDIAPKVMEQEWETLAFDQTNPFDFDAVYQKAKEKFGIEELFERLITQLEEVVESDQIDSLKAIRDLEKIIATLRQSKDGSYLATMSSYSFLLRWLQNSGWELFGSIPVAGSFVKGLKETLKEADDKMEKMKQSITDELRKELIESFPSLEHVGPDGEVAALVENDSKEEPTEAESHKIE